MIRVSNWDLWLLEWADSLRGKPYVWGETDCGSLVRAAMRGIYGQDAFAHVKPYTSKASALRACKQTGGVSAVLEASGWKEVPVSFARQGDVLITPVTDENGFPGAGIVVARQLVLPDPLAGVDLVPWQMIRELPQPGVLLRGP